MIDIVPALFIGAFFGGLAGYGFGICAGKDRLMAAANEDDLLREVRNRRFRARLHDEIEEQVEKEAGPKSTVF